MRWRRALVYMGLASIAQLVPEVYRELPLARAPKIESVPKSQMGLAGAEAELGAGVRTEQVKRFQMALDHVHARVVLEEPRALPSDLVNIGKAAHRPVHPLPG
jgi:hypothetical protein